jgi:hypothetical protein
MSKKVEARKITNPEVFRASATVNRATTSQEDGLAWVRAMGGIAERDGRPYSIYLEFKDDNDKDKDANNKALGYNYPDIL